MIKVVFTNFITRNELRLNKWDYTIYFSTIDSSFVTCHLSLYLFSFKRLVFSLL